MTKGPFRRRSLEAGRPVGRVVTMLRAVRYAERLTQEQMAGRLGIKRQYLSSLECGLHPVSDGVAATIAEALRADPGLRESISPRDFLAAWLADLHPEMAAFVVEA